VFGKMRALSGMAGGDIIQGSPLSSMV